MRLSRVFVLLIDALFGAAFLFLHRVLYCENSIETVAIFLYLRMKHASNSSKRERKFPVTLGIGAKYE